MSTTNDVLYYENALVIRIPTASPETLHALMLRGLVTSLRLFIQSDERVDEDIDGLVALANVLQKITPTEIQLQRAYELHKAS